MTESRSIALDTKTLSAEGKSILAALKSEIVGQDRALMEVVKALEIAKSPLCRTDRPLGVFLCLGPTGTGKTSLPKILAKHLFGSERALTAISLNNFSEDHRTSTLEGSPPGYVGYIDPRDPENTFSREPTLRQWNIDRHHQHHLAKIHADEIAHLNKVMDKIWTLEKKLTKFGKERKELEDKAAGLEDELKKTSKDNDGAAKRKKLEEKIVVIQDELKKIHIKKSTVHAHWWRLRGVMREIFERANREGWIYDPAKPPTGLMSVVVFDEIEKADSRVLNHLMTIMDEARLTLANGEETSFRNSVIFMTSNTGQEEMDPDKKIGLKRYASKDLDKMVYATCLAEAKRTFRREFIARFSKILVFRSLRRDQLMEIFDIQVRRLHDSFKEGNVALLVKVDEAVKTCLVDLAMKYPEEGARIMERRFRDKVIADLAMGFNTKQINNPGEIKVSLLSSEGDSVELGYEYFPVEQEGKK